MLGSITPLGERGRGSRWGRTVTAYVARLARWRGSSPGAALGCAGRPCSRVRARARRRGWACWPSWWPLGLAARPRRALGLRLPTVHRQVNEDWMVRYRGWVYGLGFGLQLGTGVVTVVTTSAVYAMWVAALLSGRRRPGALIGADVRRGALPRGLRGGRGTAARPAGPGRRRPAALGRPHPPRRRWRAGALVTVALDRGRGAMTDDRRARHRDRRAGRLGGTHVRARRPAARRQPAGPASHEHAMPTHERSSFAPELAARGCGTGALVALLVEFEHSLADKGLYAPQGLDLPLRRDRFHPRALQVPSLVQEGHQRFFSRRTAARSASTSCSAPGPACRSRLQAVNDGPGEPADRTARCGVIAGGSPSSCGRWACSFLAVRPGGLGAAPRRVAAGSGGPGAEAMPMAGMIDASGGRSAGGRRGAVVRGHRAPTARRSVRRGAGPASSGGVRRDRMRAPVTTLVPALVGAADLGPVVVVTGPGDEPWPDGWGTADERGDRCGSYATRPATSPRRSTRASPPTCSSWTRAGSIAAQGGRLIRWTPSARCWPTPTRSRS